jgi:hypothetical protein
MSEIAKLKTRTIPELVIAGRAYRIIITPATLMRLEAAGYGMHKLLGDITDLRDHKLENPFQLIGNVLAASLHPHVSLTAAQVLDHFSLSDVPMLLKTITDALMLALASHPLMPAPALEAVQTVQ